MRGESEDSAVLCTDSETYDVKKTSTSNTLILFDDLNVTEALPDQEQSLFVNKTV